MKSGLNMSDVNILRRGLEAGYDVAEIARSIRCKPETVVRYIDSMEAKKAPAKKKVAKKKAETADGNED